VTVAEIFLLAFAVYALAGLLFALAFVFRGASAMDPAAKSGTIGFRLLILPGAAAFWPLLLLRWVVGDRKDQA
jgi:hypothetical protein